MAALGNAIQLRKEKNQNWAAYAIHYENSSLAVYDLSYILGTKYLKAALVFH